MTKNLLILVLLTSGSFLVGRGYELKKRTIKSDKCINRIMEDDQTIHDFFGHKVKTKNMWTHSEAMVAHKYTFCILGKDNG